MTAQASGSGTSPATGHGRERAHRARHYLVRDDETGITYSFGYADIVTEGFRTPHRRTGPVPHRPARPGHASYVIRLDLPDIEDYYQ